MPIDPTLAATAIQAGAQTGTNLINWITGFRENRRARDFAREMADYTYQKDLEMWNRANEYNTPANQMKRFEEAGLNPRLIYGQGNPGNTTVTMPKYQDIQGKFGNHLGDFPSLIQMYQDFQIKKEQTDLLKAQIQTQESINFKTQAETDSINLMNALRRVYTPEQWQKYDENKEAFFEEGMGMQDVLGRRSLTEWQMDAIKAGINQKNASINSLIERMNLTSQQKNWLVEKINAFQETGVNIDRDEIQYRVINRIFGEALNHFINQAKSNH